MKLKLNRLLLAAPLLLALAIAPAWAQDNADNNPAPRAAENNNNTPPPPAINQDTRISASELMAMNREYLEKMEELTQRAGRRDNGSDFSHTIVALTAIIVPFFFIAALATGYFYWRHRRNAMLHETLRVMIDKGVPIPPELIVPPERKTNCKSNYDLRAGLIMIGIGIALFLMHRGFWQISFIPLFIGIALLIVRRIEKKNQNGLKLPLPTIPSPPTNP